MVVEFKPVKKYLKICEKYQTDWHTIDWGSLTQQQKDYTKEEFDEIVRKEIKQNSDLKADEIRNLEIGGWSSSDVKQLQSEQEIEELKQHRIETEKKYKKILKEIKTTPTPNIDKITWKLNEFINLTLSNQTERHTLFISGKAGIGKTYVITKLLKKYFGSEVKNIIKGGHCTPLDYYNLLYDNPKGIFYWDDLSGLYNNSETGLSLLKQTTESGKERYVRYSSTTSKLAHRNKEFIFEGKQIFALNNYPKNSDFQPIISRARIIKFEPNYQEILQMMFEIIKTKWDKILLKEKIKIVETIERNTNEATKNFDLRLLVDSVDFYVYCKGINDKFNKLLGELIEIDRYKEMVLKLSEEDLIIKEQEKIFREKTGMSKPTFYRYRRDLNLKKLVF